MRGVKTGGRAVDERLLETVEAFIKKHQRTNGRSPTLRQIMHEFPREFPALSKVQRYVLILKREGRISKRAVKVVISLTNACLAVVDRTSSNAEFGAHFGLYHSVHIAIQDGKFQSG